MEYPRVLIISPNALNPICGGGVFLANLFHDWPKENLADIYSLSADTPNYDICNNYYKLYPRITKNPMEWMRRLTDYMHGVNESLDGITSIRITKGLLKWLNQFEPQIIYSHLGPLWLTRLTNKIADIYDIPLVVHIMDDYIIDWPVSGHKHRNIFPLTQILHKLNKQEFCISLQKSQLRYCISQSMSEEYNRRYGYMFRTLFNGIEPERWMPTKRIEEQNPNGAFRMLYAGSISANTNLNSLAEIVEAVAFLNQRDVPINMDIIDPANGFQYESLLARDGVVSFQSAVSHDKMPQLLTSYDLLLLPFNFDKDSLRFFKYSWPTKMSEYMASGVPICIYGPQDTAFTQYAERDKWAYVISTHSVEVLTKGLARLTEDTALREELSQTARRKSVEDQDIHKIRQDFHNDLRSLVS